jgi:hypothetical protein
MLLSYCWKVPEIFKHFPDPAKSCHPSHLPISIRHSRCGHHLLQCLFCRLFSYILVIWYLNLLHSGLGTTQGDKDCWNVTIELTTTLLTVSIQTVRSIVMVKIEETLGSPEAVDSDSGGPSVPSE